MSRRGGFRLLPIVLFGLYLGYYFLANREEVPLTGRKQLVDMSREQEASLGLSSYQQILRQSAVVRSGPEAALVKSIGQRIAKVSEDPGFEWQYELIDDNQANAFCLPGGKVAVYTGILPITQNENGLAVVMGHEIAHAIARHGNERMSQALAIQGAGMTLEALTASKPGLTRDLFLQSYGIGSQLGMLAYSRKHETEADKMGLVFMAMAGYDPRSAPAFWQRMAAGGGAKPPEFLSTHPSDETRVHDLEAYMPEALKYYKP